MAEPKKPKVVDPEKVFIAKCKLFFSSLTARSAQHAYFNIAPNVVLLCNSTSPPPNPMHGDRIMQYGIGELTYHFIEFHDTEFFAEVRSFLQIPDDVVYCVQILNVLSLLNKFSRKELIFFDNESGIRVCLPKGRKTYEKKNLVGFQVHNFHIVGTISQWYQKTMDVGSTEHKQKFPGFEVPVDPEIPISGRIFMVPVEVDKFRDVLGVPIFRDARPVMKILGMDGLTCASIKEFYKRVINEPHRFVFYFWAIDSAYVLSMTIFENEMVTVRSIRPNILSMPVSNNIAIENVDLLAISEVSHG